MPDYLAVGDNRPFQQKFSYDQPINVGQSIYHTTMGLEEPQPVPKSDDWKGHYFTVKKIAHYPDKIELIGDWGI